MRERSGWLPSSPPHLRSTLHRPSNPTRYMETRTHRHHDIPCNPLQIPLPRTPVLVSQVVSFVRETDPRSCVSAHHPKAHTTRARATVSRTTLWRGSQTCPCTTRGESSCSSVFPTIHAAPRCARP